MGRTTIVTAGKLLNHHHAAPLLGQAPCRSRAHSTGSYNNYIHAFGHLPKVVASEPQMTRTWETRNDWRALGRDLWQTNVVLSAFSLDAE
jgi:hypothetical protein